MTNKNVTIASHALVQHKLALIRDKSCPFPEFRERMYELGLLIGAEATRDLQTVRRQTETPLATADVDVLVNPNAVVLPVLRGGLVMADALQVLLPTARCGHLGIFRDLGEQRVITYLISMPDNDESIANIDHIIVDPMIATGRTMREAISIVRRHGAQSSRIRVVALVATEQGLDHVYGDPENSDVRIFLGAIDPELNERGYIVPGLGDASDRQFGSAKPTRDLESIGR